MSLPKVIIFNLYLVNLSQDINESAYDFDEDLDEDILALEYSCEDFESESDGKQIVVLIIRQFWL